MSTPNTSRGVLFTVLAFIIWGLFPLYWKALHGIDALQIISHRIVWSGVFVAVILMLQKNWSWLLPSIKNPRVLGVFALSSLLLSLNWLLYIWAVNENRVVDASLGYFINPLINVLLGRLFLGEQLSRSQSFAVGLAALGVLWITIAAGTLPWIALCLGLSFGVYGLLRKRASLPSLEGLALETFLMAPFALSALLWFQFQGQGALGNISWSTDALLMGAGVVTALPLLMFASGARTLKLATVGVIQYIGPSLQLLLGVWLYQEPFGTDRMIGFALIWAALIIYSAAGLMSYWKASRLADQAV
ncbi:EamA family transporter RarD [Iodobacter sp. CM08]|uniref:EamA family transporter RarD n=1 Tax=Iodobacter sp. CM08 TaxID=3085902 RepID=UPI002980DD84|nr:EamA family transporter RarD [Iodobacter sp. CM08]MDW5417528.1 EamA family transporter RarD [Iodobacter sp. CM08]